MAKRKQQDDISKWISILASKAVLTVIVVVLGVATIIGLAFNYVIGIVFSVFLIIAVRALIGAKQIEEWIEDTFNNEGGLFK